MKYENRGRGAEGCEVHGKMENVMYLPSRINQLRRKVLVLVADDFAEGVLNGGIVAVDKVAVHELHRETRFAWSHRSQLLVLLTCSGQSGRSWASLTDGAAADNGHLSLLGRRHLAAGFRRRS